MNWHIDLIGRRYDVAAVLNEPQNAGLPQNLKRMAEEICAADQDDPDRTGGVHLVTHGHIGQAGSLVSRFEIVPVTLAAPKPEPEQKGIHTLA